MTKKFKVEYTQEFFFQCHNKYEGDRCNLFNWQHDKFEMHQRAIFTFGGKIWRDLSIKKLYFKDLFTGLTSAFTMPHRTLVVMHLEAA